MEIWVGRVNLYARGNLDKLGGVAALLESMDHAVICIISLQLRTTKVNQLNISGTRFFGENLTKDLKPGWQRELKTELPVMNKGY